MTLTSIFARLAYNAALIPAGPAPMITNSFMRSLYTNSCKMCYYLTVKLTSRLAYLLCVIASYLISAFLGLWCIDILIAAFTVDNLVKVIITLLYLIFILPILIYLLVARLPLKINKEEVDDLDEDRSDYEDSDSDRG